MDVERLKLAFNRTKYFVSILKRDNRMSYHLQKEFRFNSEKEN